MILPISFSASAVDVVDDTVNKVIALPFPDPQTFGENSRVFICYNDVLGRFQMFVLTFQLGEKISNQSALVFSAVPSVNTDNTKFSSILFQVSASGNYFEDVEPFENDSIYVATNLRLYQYNWYPGRTTYSVAQRTLNFSGYSSTAIVSGAHSSSATYQYSVSDYNQPLKYIACYNGTICNKKVGSDISYSFSSSASGAMLSIINEMNTTVTFYLDEILNQLKNGSSYSPSETTTNQEMSDYEQAEGVLMDDNISKLNDLSLPDLNNFNSGNQGNAFQFISSNIEFFSGMNGSGSIAKVGTVLVVLLGLGLTSFIIGLTNRRKG